MARPTPKVAIILAGLFVVMTTGLVNIGIIAMDDYEDIVANIIPAGKFDVPHLVNAADYRSAIPTISLSALARTGRALGIAEPAHQLSFVLAILGLLSLGTQLFFALRLFKLFREEGDSRETTVAFLLCFYFACPLFFTRPMIESLGVPFLVASVYFATAFWKKNATSSLAASVFFLTLAAMYRFQAGVCFLALLIVTLLSARRVKYTFTALALGALAFGATGYLDYLMKGVFHASLLAYVQFNRANSSLFGVLPFYTFLLLFLGLSMPPFLISRYRGLNWKKEYAPLVPCALYFGIFVLGHSLIPHKEERFMVTVIPLFLILLTPLANYFVVTGQRRRIAAFAILNGFLLVCASYSVAQNNVVGLGKFLERHPRIKSVVSFRESLVLLPEAFISRPLEWRLNSPAESLARMDCDDVVAVRRDLAADFSTVSGNFTKLAEFKPGLLEAVLVKLNPYRNGRRAAIEVYAPRACAGGG